MGDAPRPATKTPKGPTLGLGRGNYGITQASPSRQICPWLESCTWDVLGSTSRGRKGPEASRTGQVSGLEMPDVWKPLQAAPAPDLTGAERMWAGL